jgi:hypothetical protein
LYATRAEKKRKKERKKEKEKRERKKRKKKAVRDVRIMYQICGAHSCKNYGKKLHWEQNDGLIFHHKFVANIFHYQKIASYADK